MTQLLRSVAARCLALSAVCGGLATAGAQATATVRGVIVDSIRHGPLAGAAVDLRPRGRRVLSNDSGAFQFDSVEAGQGYQIRVAHPMLDTVGVTLATPVFAVAPGETKQISLAVPSATRLVSMFCPPGMLARGPSALVGFVRDPDTGLPLDSAKVSLVYEDASATGTLSRSAIQSRNEPPMPQAWHFQTFLPKSTDTSRTSGSA